MNRAERFPTRFGPMQADWREGRLAELRLLPPEAPLEPGQPSPFAQRVQAHCWGQSEAFEDLRLDLDRVAPFARRVYLEARRLAPGQVVSYGELARRVGSPGAARAVGTALARNPILLVVPCHRVVSTSHLGGFSAPGGVTTKERMLAAEGVGTESLWDPFQREQALEHLRRSPRLGPVVEALGAGPWQPLYPEEPFAALARNVIYQQLAGSAAAVIERRVQELGGYPFPRPETLLALDPAELRAAGLSGSKIQTLQTLSACCLEGRLEVEALRLLPDAEVIAQVVQVKGLGPWTAQMFLMFHLGRRDVFPLADLGIRKAMQRLWGTAELPTAAQMERWSRPWRPYRTMASWCLWRSLN